MDMLRQAVMVLAESDGDYASRQNGIGFNQMDSTFGHSLAEKENWTPRMTRAVWIMLRKYRGQLLSAGIDYDTIPEPPKDDESPKEARRLTVLATSKRLALISPYDSALVERFRALKSAGHIWWNQEQKLWTVNDPLTTERVAAVMQFAIDNNFEVLPAVVKFIEEETTGETSKTTPVVSTPDDIVIDGLGGTLRPFQETAVAYVKDHPACYITDEPGLGKTIEALASLQYLNAFPALVICPASVKLNWFREARKWLPNRSVQVVNGKTNSAADVVIVNYDLLWREPYKTWLDKQDFAAIVCDESHCFPGDTTVLTDRGPLCIDEIVNSKLPVFVVSCNFSRNVLEYKRVIDWMVFPSYSNIVEVQHEHGSFRCTADHKIWTEESGYQRAATIRSGQTLRMVQERVYRSSPLTGKETQVLLPQMCNRVYGTISPMDSQAQNGTQTIGNNDRMYYLSQDISDQEKGQDNSAILLPQMLSDMEDVTATNTREDRSTLMEQTTRYSRIINSNMSLLQEPDYNPYIQSKASKVLFNELPSQAYHGKSQTKGDVAESRQTSYKSTNRQNKYSSIITNDTEQSYVQPRNKRENASNASEEGTFFFESWWKTETDRTTVKTSNYIGLAYGNHNQNITSQGTISKSPTVLPSRYSQCGPTSSDRSRWSLTSNKEMEVDRLPQDSSFVSTRVVSVTLQERASDEQPRWSGSRDTAVYNITVEGNHNYFANGILVANCIKERDAKRSQAVYHSWKSDDGAWHESGLAARCKVRIFLSGTPILNRPAELVHQLAALGLIRKFGGSWKFLQRYTNPVNNGWGWDFSGAANLDELNEKLRHFGFIRREKKDVLTELPPKQFTTLPVSITNRDEYQSAEYDIIEYLADIDPDAATAAERAEFLVRIEVLKQLAAQGKLEAIKEWVGDFLETGEKLVVFAHHINVQKALLETFPGAVQVLGEDNIETRQKNIDRFQNDPECKLIVCSLVAGGFGITLTAASHVAIVEYPWSPAGLDQAVDRLHRIGQTKSVNVWQFVGQNTIDESILALLDSKREVINAATNGKDVSVMNEVIKTLRGKKQ